MAGSEPSSRRVSPRRRVGGICAPDKAIVSADLTVASGLELFRIDVAGREGRRSAFNQGDGSARRRCAPIRR